MAFWFWFLGEAMLNNDNFKHSNMHFTYHLNENRVEGHFSFTQDQSLLYPMNGADVSILLGGNWRFELMIKGSNGKCLGFQAFLGELNIEHTCLELPMGGKGELFFHCEQNLSPFCELNYCPFDKGIYYDIEKRLMCIGDKDAIGDVVEFANNIRAVLIKGNLVALYLKLEIKLL